MNTKEYHKVHNGRRFVYFVVFLCALSGSVFNFFKK